MFKCETYFHNVLFSFIKMTQTLSIVHWILEIVHWTMPKVNIFCGWIPFHHHQDLVGGEKCAIEELPKKGWPLWERELWLKFLQGRLCSKSTIIQRVILHNIPDVNWWKLNFVVEGKPSFKKTEFYKKKSQFFSS